MTRTEHEDLSSAIEIGRNVATRFAVVAGAMEDAEPGRTPSLVASGLLFGLAHAVDIVCDVATDALARERDR